MIARATLVRIALLSTALGALTGCDTVGGAVSSAGSSVGGFFSHRDPSARRPQSGATPNPRQVVVQQPAPSERQAESSAGRLAGHQLPGGDRRRRRRGAARRRPGECLGALPVQYRRYRAPMLSGRPGAGRRQDWRRGRGGDGTGGAAGTFSAPLKITVTRLTDNTSVFSQTYRAEATTDGVKAGQFRIVTDPINLPMPTLQLADLYSITVGFEGGTGGPSPTGHKSRKKRTPG